MARDDSLLYRLRRKLQSVLFKIAGATTVAKLHYFLVTHKKLHLENPVTFNDKIQWLKLNYFPNDSLAIKCSDKYRVREYIIQKGYSYLLNNLIGVWNKPEEIDWEKLPQQFVIKCNHGCAYNLICDNKNNFDTKYAKKKLNQWLGENFGEFNGETHYDKIPKKIICEEYLGSRLRDYKFFCFDGKPEFFYVSSDLSLPGKERVTYYNTDSSVAPFQDHHYYQLEKEADLSKLKEMLKIASDLSKGFPIVRVDLFLTETNKIFFSEMTFIPAAGAIELNPPVWNYRLADLIDLENLSKNGND